MRCPFPGMDPYLERPALWSDFHDSLIAYIREVLQPLLRPRYVALSQDRLYVLETERPIRPDVSVVRTRVPSGATAVLALEPDQHLVFERTAEEIRQPVLHIVEPAAGNRVVTAIEVLSPDNKSTGPGRKSYLKKCGELRQALANLVEVDLLRGGTSLLRKLDSAANGDSAWAYSVAVTRQLPALYEVYTVGLRQRLPRVGVPLDDGEPDVILDLQAAFERCWDAGPYPELLRYDAPPPADLSVEGRAWCSAVVAAG